MKTIEHIEQFDSEIFLISKCLRKKILKDVDKNITLQQVGILKYLKFHNGCKVSDIANFMQSSLSATTSLLNNMYKLNLIERNRSTKDRRLVLINITVKGYNILDIIDQNRIDFLKDLSINLMQEDIDYIHNLVRKVRIALIEKEGEESE